jgi:gluconokinase
MTRTLHVVVMGVSGIGKTTVAERLTADVDRELIFAEGDDFHPPANIAKMSSGQPLTDDDRTPWLEALADWTRTQRAAGHSTVVTCSALRRFYRDILRRGVPGTFFVHLQASEELIRRRMEGREHFMPVELLRSQLETLEPLESDEPGVVVDASRSVDDISRLVRRRILDHA